jgi:hypothetical protein
MAGQVMKTLDLGKPSKNEKNMKNQPLLAWTNSGPLNKGVGASLLGASPANLQKP